MSDSKSFWKGQLYLSKAGLKSRGQANLCCLAEKRSAIVLTRDEGVAQ